MRNQIYIILATIFLFSSCKTDSPIEAPDDIFYWHLNRNKFFHRGDTIIDVKSKIIPPFKVLFNNSYTSTGKINYTLTFDGGDTLLFLNENCKNRIEKGFILDNKLDYSSNYIVDEYVNGKPICNNDTSFFVGFKRVYSNNYQSNFGWLKIKKPLEGLWIVDEFAYNLGNHKPIIIGQKE